jgi:hypothetical protein
MRFPDELRNRIEISLQLPCDPCDGGESWDLCEVIERDLAIPSSHSFVRPIRMAWLPGEIVLDNTKIASRPFYDLTARKCKTQVGRKLGVTGVYITNCLDTICAIEILPVIIISILSCLFYIYMYIIYQPQIINQNTYLQILCTPSPKPQMVLSWPVAYQYINNLLLMSLLAKHSVNNELSTFWSKKYIPITY